MSGSISPAADPTAPGTPVVDIPPAPPHSNDPPPPPTTPPQKATTPDIGKARLVDRTESADIYQNPDGSRTARVFAGPVNWKDASGAWKRIDTKLVPDAAGALKNASGPLGVKLEGATGGASLLSVARDDWSIALVPEWAAAGKVAQATGSQLTYADVAPGVDLEYRVVGAGVKEYVVLKEPPSESMPPLRFRLKLSGVTVRPETDGSLGFYDKADKQVAVIPVGVATEAPDADATPVDPSHSHEGAPHGHATPVTPRLVEDATGPLVELEVDQAWLYDGARALPIRIDPQIYLGRAYGSAGSDAYASQDAPTSNFRNEFEWGAYVNHIGVDTSNSSNIHEHYAYLQYPIPNDVYFRQILSATWYGYFFHSPQATNQFAMYPVSQAWQDSQITWNFRPQHRADTIYGATPGDQWVTRDIGGWMVNWANGTWPNYGISMDTQGVGYYFRMAAMEQTSPDNLGSFIDVWYNNPPNTPSNLQPGWGALTTATPSLKATYTDGDGHPGYVYFQVRNSAGSVVAGEWGGPGMACNGCQVTYTPPALASGTYYWETVAYDNNAYSAWSATNAFVVDAIVPGAPTVTASPHVTQGTWYPSRTFTATLSGPSDASGISGYSVAIDQSASTLPAVCGSFGTSTCVAATANAASLNRTLAADGQWYLHARARDGAGNWSSTAAHFSLKADVTAPTAPTGLTSTPSDTTVASRSVTMNWTAGQDLPPSPQTTPASTVSGVAGYSWKFSTDPNEVPDAFIEGTTTSATSAGVADGTYWFHVVTVDQAGNKSPDTRYGPILLDGNTDGGPLTPGLLGWVAQSDQAGLEQFSPYRSFPLGSGTGYVNLRSGNLVATFDDAVVPGVGLNSVVRHVYNSQRQSALLQDNGLGIGWSLSIPDATAGLEGLDSALGDIDLTSPINTLGALLDATGTLTGNILEFTDGDGTTHRFVRQGGPGSRWDSPPGVSLRVREILSGSTVVAYEFIRTDGVIYTAESMRTLKPSWSLTTSTWKITSIRDRNGNALSFDYGDELVAGKVRLATISSNRPGVGTLAQFTWDPATAMLTKITVLPGVSASEPMTGGTRSYERWITFEYASGQLTKVNQNAQPGSDAPRSTSLGYTGGLLSSVEDGRNNTTSIGYVALSNPVQVQTITDRRGKAWSLTYNPNVLTGEQDTIVRAPIGSGTTYDTTYHTAARRAVDPANGDQRIAGGNIVSITDPGTGAGPRVSEYEWAENRLIKRYEPRLAGGTRPPNHPVWSHRYNDLGFVIEASAPSPNDPARSDLPAGATTTAVTTRFTYKPVNAASTDTFRYPPSCTDAPADTKTISEEGSCLAVMELAQTTAAAGTTAQRITEYTYDAKGNQKTVKGRSNSDGTPSAGSDRVTTFDHYTSGALKTIDGPRTDVTDVTTYGDTTDAAYGGYDRSGNPLTIKDAAGKTKTLKFSPFGMVLQQTDRDNRTSMFRYDDRDNLVESKDPRGDRLTAVFDANDNKTRETTPRGQATADADDFTTIWTYNQNDWVTQQSEPGASPADPRRISTIGYADDGAKVSEATPRSGSQTNYTHKPNRALAKVDAPGQSAAAADRAVVDYGYDDAGRTNKVTQPVVNANGDRPVVDITFTPAGLTATASETSAAAQPRAQRFAYNAHGELLRTDGPVTSVGGSEQATEHVYDTFGQVTKTRRKLDATRWLETRTGYDQAGNPVQVVQPLRPGVDLESLYHYSELNRLDQQTKDPVNVTRTLAYTYEGEGAQLTKVEKESGVVKRTVTSVYNPDGPLQSQATAANGTTLSQCNYPAGATDLTTGYDADGNLLSSRTVSATAACDATGTTLETRSFSYAPANNWLVESTQGIRSPENGTTYSRAESFGYDADGALASFAHDGRTTTLAHGAAGWTTSLTDWRSPSPRQSTTTYFPSGAPREQRQNNNVLLAASDYQPDGSLKALTWSTGTTTLRSHALQYDVRGLPTTDAMGVRQPGATSTTSGTATFGFDLVDRLTGWVAPFAESDGSRNWTHVLDDAGNITQETVRNGTTIGGGSTISDGTSTFPTGQLATRTTTAGGSLGTRVCEKFGYSTLGEETSRLLTSQLALLSCPATPAAARTTSYDPAAHTATLDDQTSPNQDATYVYSADGRLIARTNPGSTGSAKTALYFQRATGGSLAEELDGTGQTMVRYLSDDHGVTVAQESYRLANGSRAATAVWTWLLSDAGGNVGTITDDSGVVLEQEGYDYYGAVKKGGMGTPASGSAGSSLGYQGALTDRNPSDGKTRSVILRDRQYDPGVRRFTTADSLVGSISDMRLGTDDLTGNRYLFAASNPVSFYDDGHSPRYYKRHRGSIRRWAKVSQVDPITLGALIQHEAGAGMGHTALMAFVELVHPGYLRHGVGIAQIVPESAPSQHIPLEERRQRLIIDEDFAIKNAAAILGQFKAQGFTDEEAFILYAYGPEARRKIADAHFDAQVLSKELSQSSYEFFLDRRDAHRRISKEIKKSKVFK